MSLKGLKATWGKRDGRKYLPIAVRILYHCVCEDLTDVWFAI